MPFFKAVGYIDDNLTPEEVTKEYRRRYSLAAYHRKRAKIVEALGGKCFLCDAGEPLAFVKKAGAPAFRVGALVTMSEVRRKKILEHVELLCTEHVREKLYHKGRLTHGTYWAAYKKKCRCDECGEYMADYSLRRQENRRAAKTQPR